MQGRSLISFFLTLGQPSVEWVTMVSFSNEIYWCRWQCGVQHLHRVPLRPSAESRGWWCCECVDPNNFMSATGKCVGYSSIYYINSEMFKLAKNRLFAYADDSTLLAVVCKPADRPAVAAIFNRKLARMQEWCNHWCMILNPNKTKTLVVSKPRTLSPPHGDLVLSEVSIRASADATSLTRSLTASSPSKTMCVELFPVSLRELELWGWGNIIYISGYLCVTS